MTVQEALENIRSELKTIYEEGESNIIGDWVIEYITGAKDSDRITNKNKELSAEQQTQLRGFTRRLLQHEPVQYVLNESWFCGLKFYVDKRVLIPRPETEELVEWIITNCRFPINQLTILDIGAGSGCIPISLKRKLRKAIVSSYDISEEALEVAKKNSAELGADVNFLQLDFLDEKERERLSLFDIIVSNPPYVPQKDKATMNPNVLNYEPATALFVPDNDPLIFYKAIADFGKKHLTAQGTIYTEIHENLGEAVTGLFTSNGYSIMLKKDMQGKDRMIKATL